MRIREAIDRYDARVASLLEHWGHFVEREGIGLVFVWFGALKLMGEASASSIIAKTVYFGDPAITVPLLGLWEVLIGICFIVRPLVRVAIALLFLRFPGSLLALVLRYDDCFVDSVLVPSIQGQYIIKELTIIGAALVIGGTVRTRRHDAKRL